MKKSRLAIVSILFVLLMGCLTMGCESGEKYFHGTVTEDYDTYFVIEPDENEDVRKKAELLVITKDVLLKDGVPELEVGDTVRVLYQGKIQETDRGFEPEIVCAVYTEEQLEEWNEQ